MVERLREAVLPLFAAGRVTVPVHADVPARAARGGLRGVRAAGQVREARARCHDATRAPSCSPTPTASWSRRRSARSRAPGSPTWSPTATTTIPELAAESGLTADSLHRILRALAALEIFSLDGDVVRNTPKSELLRADVPGSVAWIAQSFANEHYRVWEQAEHAFRTGTAATPEVLGSGYFDWLGDHPAEAAIFNRAMAAGSALKLAVARPARLVGRAGRRRRRWHRRAALRAARAASGPPRDRRRPAALRGGGPRDVRGRRRRRPVHVRERQLLRVGSRGRRRLRALAHPPRLGRRAGAPHPACDPRGRGRRGTAADPRQRADRRARERWCRS